MKYPSSAPWLPVTLPMTGRFLLLLMLPACVVPALATPQKSPEEIVLGDCLGLARVGRYGRIAAHIDALEEQIVAGRWKAPRAGDTVRWAGDTRTWEKTSARNGSVNQPALAGGYLYWKVHADAPRVLLLEAAGHVAVYINGELRPGDPYRHGYVRLPVKLREGDNDLLFHVGDRPVSARLIQPAHSVLLDTRDATTPDLLSGMPPPWAAVVILNTSYRPLAGCSLRASCEGGQSLSTPVPLIPPLSVRKVGFLVPNPDGGESVDVHLSLEEAIDGKAAVLDRATLTLRHRRSDEVHKRTFVSGVDGSVQYFALCPAKPAPKESSMGLVLSLHGAAVEALGQASCYQSRSWAHVVAPTNRRPFGFDWEDWGRMDALEVLELARQQLHTDPLRTWLTGHSMGGHGTWQVGLSCPDRFAAIAPSAGWVSFQSYIGTHRSTNSNAVEAMLLRAGSPSDTLSLVHNCAPQGVYVLHGDRDDNVPVREARTMRQQLGKFHADFAYYERPGAGHWWGNECVDWPPLMEFLSRHTLPRRGDVRQIDFTTASPGVSPRCHWAVIESQLHALQPSTVHLRLDRDKRRIMGTTDNVARLALDLIGLPSGKPLAVELDGQALEKIPYPASAAPLRLWREGGQWALAEAVPTAHKGPHRYGPFKEAFRDHFQLVYGTHGTTEENAWAFAKARYDAEAFWYRGNGAADVIPDTAFDPHKEPDRGVILYGNAQTHGAWKALLGDSPVQIRPGVIEVGSHKETGNDLACLFLRPRPGSDRALVGVVSGTGPAGMRLTDRLPYFISGVAFPDCTVLGPDVLRRGTEAIRGAGFFGNDWSVESGDWAWASP